MKRLDMESYHRLMQFAKKKRPAEGYSNLYRIRTIDHETGNIESEYYGMNHMTNYGIQKYADYVNNLFPKLLYIGDGAVNNDNFNRSNPRLIHPLTNTPATVTTVLDYNIPVYFDKDSRDITTVCHFITATIPYYEPGFPCYVTEYGLSDTTFTESPSGEYLWTHSKVYDIEGNVTSVQKKISSDLEIDVFLCVVINESIITSSWNRGVYPIITSPKRFIETGMYGSGILAYQRYNRTNSAGAMSRNSVNPSTNVTVESNSFPATSQYQYARIVTLPAAGYSIDAIRSESTKNSGYCDGFIQYCNGFSIVTPTTLSTPMQIRYPVKMVFENWKETGLADQFGNADLDAIPITQLQNATHCYLFNHYTGYYDNDTGFTNDDSHIYTETTLETACATPISYTRKIGNNETLIHMYVYQNLNVDDPILRFDNNTSDINTIIATDSYWDKTTYNAVVKTDPETINHSENHVLTKSYRYYLTNTDQTSLKPIRQSAEFTLTNACRTIPWWGVTESKPTGFNIVADNYEKNWFIRKNIIYFTNDLTSVDLSSKGMIYRDSNCYFTYQEYLLIVQDDTNILIFDTSVHSMGIQKVISNPFNSTTTTNYTKNTYKTKSGTGIVCLQSIKENKAVIFRMDKYQHLNLDQDNITLIETPMCCCIWNTNKIAYIKTIDNVKKLCIKDLDSEEETVYSLQLQDVTSSFGDYVVMLIGHTNHLYAITKTGSNVPITYYLDLSKNSDSAYFISSEVSLFSTAFYRKKFGSGNVYVEDVKELTADVEYECVDDAMILYVSSDTVRLASCLYYIDIKNHPDVCGNVLGTGFIKDISTNVENAGTRKYCTLRYINQKTLVLLFLSSYGTTNLSSAIIGFCDFGKFLNVVNKNDNNSTENNLEEMEQGTDYSTMIFDTNHAAYIPYGEYFVDPNQRKIVPIEYALKHVIVGKTKTICALTEHTMIYKKSWLLYFSNYSNSGSGSSEFPPGVQQ